LLKEKKLSLCTCSLFYAILNPGAFDNITIQNQIIYYWHKIRQWGRAENYV